MATLSVFEIFNFIVFRKLLIELLISLLFSSQFDLRPDSYFANIAVIDKADVVENVNKLREPVDKKRCVLRKRYQNITSYQNLTLAEDCTLMQPGHICLRTQ